MDTFDNFQDLVSCHARHKQTTGDVAVNNVMTFTDPDRVLTQEEQERFDEAKALLLDNDKETGKDVLSANNQIREWEERKAKVLEERNSMFQEQVDVIRELGGDASSDVPGLGIVS